MFFLDCGAAARLAWQAYQQICAQEEDPIGRPGLAKIPDGKIGKIRPLILQEPLNQFQIVRDNIE